MNSVLNELRQIIDLPIEKAVCLPFSAYRDNDVYQQEKKHVFHTDWVFVCAENELSNKGDFYAFFLADEPIVVLRGQDKNIRAMSNVCRHRGTLLNSLGKGNTKRMICPYHAWTYNDQGKFLGAPFSNNQVDKNKHCLHQFNIEVWQGLIFISLSKKVTSLKDRYADINKYFDLFATKRFTKTYTSDTEEWQTNWKLALENAMESYHLFQVHHDTLEKETPTKQSFYLEGCTDWSVTAGKISNTGNKIINWMMGSHSTEHEHYVLISLPPSFVGILTYESFDWVSILPNGATNSMVKTGGMSTVQPSKNSDEQAFANAFLAEDKQICERVQLGMSAEHTSGGKLIEMERVIVDFHHYLAQQLFNHSTREHHRTAAIKEFFSIDK